MPFSHLPHHHHSLTKASYNIMLFTRLGAFVLGVSLVNAFKDTSPFFLFSTSE